MTDDYDVYDPKYNLTKREKEIKNEMLRDEFSAKLWDNARLLDDAPLLRHVDAEQIANCRLSIYGKRSNAIRRMDNFAEEEAMMDKFRDARGVSASKLEDRLDPREIPLEMSLEELYFKTFGENSQGYPFPDKIDGGYKCACGTRMMMPWKLMRFHCPSCGRQTPVGKLHEEGVLHR